MVPDQHRAFQGVYLIAPDLSGPTKVGISSCVASRVGQIQSGCWERLSVFSFSYFFKPHPGVPGAAKSFEGLSYCAREIERGTHKVFKDFELDLTGEWADVSVDDAAATIRKVASNIGVIECHCGPDKPFTTRTLIENESVGLAFQERAWAAVQAEINKSSMLLRNRA